MIWQNLKHGGFEGGEYFKLPRRFKLLVTHSSDFFRVRFSFDGVANVLVKCSRTGVVIVKGF